MNRTPDPSPGMSLLRVYALAGDRVGGKELAAAIVESARAHGLKGATVLAGLTGFGRHGFDTELMALLHNPMRQPVVIEIVDETAKLKAFLPALFELNRAGRLVTLEALEVHAYHPSRDPAGQDEPGEEA